MERPEWIVVGRVVRAHGLRGEVRVQSESDNPDRFAPGEVMFCRPERSAGAARPRDAAGGAPDSGAGGAAAGGRPPGSHGAARAESAGGAATVAAGGRSPTPAPAGGRRELRIEEVRFTTGALLVAFAGVEDRTAAEKLRGCVLEVPASSLPELEEDEYYPFELRGLRVWDEEGVEVGTVLELLDTPAQPVLSLRRAAGGEVLVPFTHEAVPTVDVPGGRLVVLRRFILE